MTSDPISVAPDGLAIGRGALLQLHQSLARDAADTAVAILHETGYASGAGLYRAFSAWVQAQAGVGQPEQLDAMRLNDVLSAFFRASGWGTLTVAPLSGAALAVDATDWAEAVPGSAQTPMCFFSSGMLADFFGRLSGEPVAVMEVECRSRNDQRCRFLSASPERLQQVYEQMTQGKSYEEALTAARR